MMRKRESVAARRINRVLLRRLDVSRDGATTKTKETRHDQLQAGSGCACRHARRERAGIAELCTGRRPRNQPRARAGHSPVQPVGGPISAVPLEQHGNLSVPRLHDRTRPAGKSLTRIARIGAPEPGKADQDGARTIKWYVAPDRI